MKKIFNSIMVAFVMLLASTKLNPVCALTQTNYTVQTLTSYNLTKKPKQSNPDQPVLVLNFKRDQQKVALITEVKAPTGVGSYDNRRENLVKEVSRYLKDINAATKVSAEHIVDICLKEQFNISFLLAEGTLETNMGTEGIAKYNNSIFGFPKYYKHPTMSIIDFIRVILKLYSNDTNNCTDGQMLVHNYASINGQFPREVNYEKNLQRQYTEILQNYRIQDLQYTSVSAAS